jgi:hypothetical protein
MAGVPSVSVAGAAAVICERGAWHQRKADELPGIPIADRARPSRPPWYQEAS